MLWNRIKIPTFDGKGDDIVGDGSALLDRIPHSDLDFGSQLPQVRLLRQVELSRRVPELSHVVRTF